MELYRMDVSLVATAYVKAQSEHEAREKIEKAFGKRGSHSTGAELPIGEGIDVTVSGRMFDDPRLPEISLSPAVTFYGANVGDGPEEVE